LASPWNGPLNPSAKVRKLEERYAKLAQGQKPNPEKPRTKTITSHLELMFKVWISNQEVGYIRRD
jgi:hypothetical protein